MLALGLTLMLCAGAAAETTDDISYTMAEKLMKQLEAGSGFAGTLTMTATAAEGRESEAFSTVKPITLDWTYINVRSDDETSEARVSLTMNSNDYQQGSAEASLRDGTVYFTSSLTGDDWYAAATDTLPSVAGGEALAALPDASDLVQLRGLLPASLTFFANMTGYFVGGNFDGLSESMEQYTTKIDFWLEGYRDSVQMDTREDGSSIMEIEYCIPAAAVKSQLKQLLIDLMNDEALLAELAALMPEDQAELYLSPSLQPYYFYAVNELPLEEDLVIRREVSFMGETVELSVTMPLYDSVNGSMTLQYIRTQDGNDMPYENILRLTGENSSAELSYRTYETITGSSVYQGTLRVEGTDENGEKLKTLWLSFDVSGSSVTTKDLNGYETLNQSLKVSVAPGEIGDDENAQDYVTITKADLALDMSFSSLSAKNSPTDVNITLTLGGEDMAQEIALEFSGTTTAKWTPETIDISRAVSLADMTQEDLAAMLSQAGIKASLLFLPYVNLPQISTDTAD